MSRTHSNHIVVGGHTAATRIAMAGCLGGLVLVAACGSSSGSGTATDSGAAMDSGTGTTIPDTGETTTTPLGLGFYPSNISCALTTAALDSAVDGGVDLSMLGDVDISDNIGIPSDSDLTSDLETLEGVQGNVVYTTIRQGNGVKVGIYIAKSWTVEAGITVGLTGAYPIAFVALTNITVNGNLVATGGDLSNAPGAYNDNSSMDDTQGQGPGGGAAGVTGTSGAGGGSYCGTGGAGGGATATTAAYGTPAIIPLVGGSAGGNGDAAGGQGGGAVQLVAGVAISIGAGGAVTAGGDGAGDGSAGGGSGGAILLEAPTASVAGTLAANGGGGSASGDGNSGADALATTMPATGGSGTPAGGNGSAATTIAGSPGGASGGGFGGGGGGAGFIRINTTSGTATISAPQSPDVTTECVSQGEIAASATCS
jgi:hypothetical protein